MTNGEYRRLAKNSRGRAITILGKLYGWDRGKNRNYKVPDGYQIHHIDRNPLNNNIDNLQLLTVDEHKMIHEQERNLILSQNIKNGCGKLSNGNKKMVLCVETGIIYKSRSDAHRKTGIDTSRICKVIDTNYTAGGYHWKSVEGGDK